MKFNKFFLLGQGSVIVNQEAEVVLPAVLKWPENNNIIIDGELISVSHICSPEKFCIYKCAPNVFAITRAERQEEFEVQSQHKGFTIVKSSNQQAVAIDEELFVATEIEQTSNGCKFVNNLDTMLGHARVGVVDNGKLEENYIATTKNISSVNEADVAFVFMQCISLQDYSNAKEFLNMQTSSQHLEEYFGICNVLHLPNSAMQSRLQAALNISEGLGQQVVFAAKPCEQKNFYFVDAYKFTVQHGKITEIE